LIGAFPAIDTAAARIRAGEIMTEVTKDRNVDPQANRKAERSSGTFDDLVTRYRVHAMAENKSWKQPDALVKRHLLPHWGKLTAASIIRSDVKTMLTRITAPIVANQTLAAASAIFTWAIGEEFGGVKINPCIGVKRNKTTARERVLSDTEIPKFWTAFDEAGLLHSRCLQMILLTGQRPGEVAHMRTEHIVDGWWTLPGDPVPALGWPGTKNGATHLVWLPKPAQTILTEIDNPGMVFAVSRRGLAISNLDGAMRDICKTLDVERATPHDLRRTDGTRITSLGFGRDAMNRIQNHKDGGIADVYDQHRYADENKRIMETVASKIMSLIEPGPDNVVAMVR
jgi:integrase